MAYTEFSLREFKQSGAKEKIKACLYILLTISKLIPHNRRVNGTTPTHFRENTNVRPGLTIIIYTDHMTYIQLRVESGCPISTAGEEEVSMEGGAGDIVHWTMMGLEHKLNWRSQLALTCRG